MSIQLLALHVPSVLSRFPLLHFLHLDIRKHFPQTCA